MFNEKVRKEEPISASREAKVTTSTQVGGGRAIIVETTHKQDKTTFVGVGLLQGRRNDHNKNEGLDKNPRNKGHLRKKLRAFYF